MQPTGTAAKSVRALALAVGVLLVSGAGVTALMGVASAGKSGQSNGQDCSPPDHRLGLAGWKHGNSFSLVAPPNWNCGGNRSANPRCNDEGPDHRMGLSGWKHGNSFSLVPPPGWNCSTGSTGSSASPTTSPSPSPSPVADSAMGAG